MTIEAAHAISEVIDRAEEVPRASLLDKVIKRGRFNIGSNLEIAKRFLEEFEPECGPIVYSEGNFYKYVGSHWALLDETEMKRSLNKYDGWRYGEKGVVRLNHEKTSSILRSVATEREQREFFFLTPAGINAKNGFITFGSDGTPGTRTARPRAPPASRPTP